MQLATITAGVRIKFHDEIYNVVGLNADTKTVSLVSDEGVQRQFELAVLLEQYKVGNARPISEGKVFRDVAQERYAARKRVQKELLVDLPDAVLEQIEFRRALLSWIQEKGIPLSHRLDFSEALAEFRAYKKLPADAWMPSLSTVQRWRKRHWAGHGCPSSLTPQYRSRGGPGVTRLQPEVEDLMKRCIDNYFLTTERQSARKAYQILVGDIANTNKYRTPQNLLACPGKMSFMRRIRSVPAYTVFAARYGKQAAEHRFRSATTGTSNRFSFMEAWEMDHTLLDVILIDQETGLAVGRPRLTLIIEVRSRMVMAFTIGFDGMSAIASLECLERAILPKNRSELQAMGVKGVWPALGVPLVMIMDNGTDFHSKALRAALLELGIEAHYAPRKKAWFKGAVERAIQSFCREGTGYLPGATVSPHARAALGLDKDSNLDPSKLAVIDLKQLNSVLHRWLVDQHLVEPKKALREMSPVQFWESHATPERLQIPEDVERLSMLCSLTASRVIKTTGLDLCNLQTFNSPELQKVRRDHGHKGIAVQVRYSPRKLDRLWFEVPGTGDWCEVLNSDPETRDLSELQIKLVIAHQRAAAKDVARQVSFSEARRDLMKWARDMRTAGSQAQRRMVSKLLGLTTNASNGSDIEDALPGKGACANGYDCLEGQGHDLCATTLVSSSPDAPNSTTNAAHIPEVMTGAKSSPLVRSRKHGGVETPRAAGVDPKAGATLTSAPSTRSDLPPRAIQQTAQTASAVSFDDFDAIPTLNRS